jgi:hypothetical protein
MSIAIATMGKFVPAVGGTPTIVERKVYVGRGSSDGWETVHKKPQIVVSRVEVEESAKREDIEIQVLSIEED